MSASNARACTAVLRALNVCAVVHVVSFFARGAQARLSPLAEAGRTPHLPLPCTLAVQEGLCAQTQEKGRWSVEGGGETKKERLCTHVSDADTVDTVNRVCTVVCASCVCRVRAMCYALRCGASRRALRLAHTSLG